MTIVYVVCGALMLAALVAWIFGGRWNGGNRDDE
jgi:hypothetical protein